MSARLMRAVQDSALAANLKPYALAFARHANDDGSACRPSVERVAWYVGVTDRPARTATAQLRRLGVLVLVRRHAPGRPAGYHFERSALPPRPPLNLLQAMLPIDTERHFSTRMHRRTQAVGSRVNRLSAAGDCTYTGTKVQKAAARPKPDAVASAALTYKLAREVRRAHPRDRGPDLAEAVKCRMAKLHLTWYPDVLGEVLDAVDSG